MNGDFRLVDNRNADFRSQATPSPCSEIDTVGTSPSSPVSVTMEHVEADLLPDSLQHHHALHNRQNLRLSPRPQHLAAASSAARTVTSSFLIKDILGDSKPLATCAPYSTAISSPPLHTAKSEVLGTDTFRPKLEQDEDSELERRYDTHHESKCNGGKEDGDREISSSRESPPIRSKKPRKARTAFSDNQLNQLERSFERQKYLSVQDRMDLAATLNLTDTQVKTWYQNRRYDEMEAADRCGTGVAGRGWELQCSTKNVPVAIFLSSEHVGRYGRLLGSSRSCRYVQRHVPDTTGASPHHAQTFGPQSSHPRAGTGGATCIESTGKFRCRHAASPLNLMNKEKNLKHTKIYEE
ncbi:hypothetical protein JZ751_009158, partial [Albula glossodonta]